MNDKPSCNIPVTGADLEGIRDGAGEAYDPSKDGDVSTRAYWDLRMIAYIDELKAASTALLQAFSNTRNRMNNMLHKESCPHGTIILFNPPGEQPYFNQCTCETGEYVKMADLDIATFKGAFSDQ